MFILSNQQAPMRASLAPLYREPGN